MASSAGNLRRLNNYNRIVKNGHAMDPPCDSCLLKNEDCIRWDGPKTPSTKCAKCMRRGNRCTRDKKHEPAQETPEETNDSGNTSVLSALTSAVTEDLSNSENLLKFTEAEEGDEPAVPVVESTEAAQVVAQPARKRTRRSDSMKAHDERNATENTPTAAATTRIGGALKLSEVVFNLDSRVQHIEDIVRVSGLMSGRESLLGRVAAVEAGIVGLRAQLEESQNHNGRHGKKAELRDTVYLLENTIQKMNDELVGRIEMLEDMVKKQNQESKEDTEFDKRLRALEDKMARIY